MFSTVWQKKENGEEGKPGRKFSLPGPQFSSSQIERKRLERKVLSQYFYTNDLSFLTVTATQQRRRRQFSNHPLSTTQLSPPQPKNNSKSTQNNLKSTQTSLKNPSQTQLKTKSTQNQTQNPQKINKIKPLTENP